MKKMMILMALGGLLAGCAWVSGNGRTSPESSSSESWGSNSGISTGADVGEHN